MTSKKTLISIISGELSGDQYAADLINEIKMTSTNVEFNGIGGSLSHSAGLRHWPDCQPKALMAVTALVQNLFHFRRLLHSVKEQLQNAKPDLLILIDYAGFNLRVAAIAYDLKIPVFYYIPPKVWAWGGWRLRKLKRFVNWVAPIYPFEADFFANKGLQHFLVRHPFIKKMSGGQVSVHQHTLALLPGSRDQEVKSLLPVMLDACSTLLTENPLLRFKLFCSSPDQKKTIQSFIEACYPTMPLRLIESDYVDHLCSCRAAIVCSGTAAFECAMLSVPMVVVYKSHWVNYVLFKLLVSLRWISLPNLILQDDAVVELLQSQCNAGMISRHIADLMCDGEVRKKQLSRLAQLHMNMTQGAHVDDIGDIVKGILSINLDMSGKVVND